MPKGRLCFAYYNGEFEEYAGEILAVEINYDKDDVNNPHNCRIERLEKQ
nr:hypothetical protein [uncultured Acetatifactor sp.]